MPDLSRARLFFDEIFASSAPFVFLSNLLKLGDAAAENGWRDYKEAGFLGKTGDRNDELQKIKETWSENLSAFANTGGGVLIWGIKTAGAIPAKLSLASDCDWLAERLRSLINDATDPHIAGVHVEAVKEPDNAPNGFVVCYIPHSTFAPHQAQWGERTYFIRAQDSNLPCPQPLLRAMFFPRVQARLEPHGSLRSGQDQRNTMVWIEIRIRSLGPATADVAMVQVEVRNLECPKVSYSPAWEEMAPSFLKYRYPLPPNLLVPHQISVRGIFTSEDPTVVLRFFSNDTPAHQAILRFTKDEVLERLKTKTSLERVARSEPIYP